MPKKSIFRQPGAQHFQLVHRSQRDPLIHDPDASQHVLKSIERQNVKKGKTKAELEDDLEPADLEHDRSTIIGEAALYGVYYDDADYNYMQHLRTVGADEEGVESILIKAPISSQKQKTKQDPITLRDLPAEVLPSTSELARNYESQQGIPASIAGFQPDMDPHLRQVLDALEDDAFVDDGLDDDFFGELMVDGERGLEEDVRFEFHEDGEAGIEKDGGDELNESWERRFAQFKKEHKVSLPSDAASDAEVNTEVGDMVGNLPALHVIGGKRRRKGTSDASGYSMSSSSLFRNQALQTLDERFDRLLRLEEEAQEQESLSDDSHEEAPDLIISREGFNSMVDEFLYKYEISGKKMVPKVDGDTGIDNFDTIRRAMGQDDRVRYENDSGTSEEGALLPLEYEDKDRWDCETVLTTYSNLENHPRLIRARDSKLLPKIRLNPRTGLPIVVDENPPGKSAQSPQSMGDVSEQEDNLTSRTTITRPRNEPKDEKKARKQGIKAERQARRIDKKATKEQFSIEQKHQMKGVVNIEKPKLRKL